MHMDHDCAARELFMRMRGGVSVIRNKISLPVANNSGARGLLPLCQEAPSRTRMEASYLAETAVALPFFAGFLTALLFFFQILCVQQEVGGALLFAGRELSALECDAGGTPGAGIIQAKTLFLKNLKKDSSAESFVKGGRLGISLARSEFSGHYICLKAEYRMQIPFGLFGRREIRMEQRLTCRKWTGKSLEEDDEIVYVAKSGSVYHRKRECSYLNPSVERTDGSGVSKLRNASGGKYYPCAKCIKGKKLSSGTVYITRYGNRYHGKRNCSEITRQARAVRLAEVKDRKACGKCGRKEDI